MEDYPCARLERCQEPLASFKNGSRVFPSIDHHALHQVCRSVDTISECVKKIQPPCVDSKSNLYYEQNRGILEFFCGPGFHNYTMHRECLDSAAVKEMGEECYLSYRWRLHELGQNKTEETKLGVQEAMCSAVDDLIECIIDGVKKNCTHAAGEFSRQLKQAIWDPMKNIFKCQDLLPQARPIQPPIIFIIVFTAVMIAAVVLLVGFVYRHGRKSQSTAYPSSSGVRSRFLNSSQHKRSLTGRTTDGSGRIASLVQNLKFTEPQQANKQENESESLKSNHSTSTSETKLEMSPTGQKSSEQSRSPKTYSCILKSSGE